MLKAADLLNELLALPGAQENLVPDPHLAALTLRAWAHAVFRGWGFLRWINPLARLLPFQRLDARRPSVGGLG